MNWKKALISLLIGATTAFIMAFAQGLIDLLQSLPSTAVSGATASLIYGLRR